jgi:WD40 repeat protein
VQFIKGIQGPLAITACYDGGIRLWDVKRGSLLKHIPDARRVVAVSLAVSADQRFIAAGHSDRRIRVWRLDDFEQIAVIPSNVVPKGIALLEGADILAVSEQDKLILWSVHEEIELLTLHFNGSFAVSPDGKQLAVPTSQMIHIFDGTPRDYGTE